MNLGKIIPSRFSAVLFICLLLAPAAPAAASSFLRPLAAGERSDVGGVTIEQVRSLVGETQDACLLFGTCREHSVDLARRLIEAGVEERGMRVAVMSESDQTVVVVTAGEKRWLLDAYPVGRTGTEHEGLVQCYGNRRFIFYEIGQLPAEEQPAIYTNETMGRLSEQARNQANDIRFYRSEIIRLNRYLTDYLNDAHQERRWLRADLTTCRDAVHRALECATERVQRLEAGAQYAAAGSPMGLRSISSAVLRPMAREERGAEVFGVGACGKVVVGERIPDVGMIPHLRDAYRQWQAEEPRLSEAVGPLVFRFADGLLFPMQVCGVAGGYEVLVDRTYANNLRLSEEVASGGLSGALIVHHVSCMDMAAREILLRRSGAVNGARQLDIEVAKIIAERARLNEGPECGIASMPLDEAGRGRLHLLAGVLDRTCLNGYTGRFSMFYRVLVELNDKKSESDRKSGNGGSNLLFFASGVTSCLRATEPALSGDSTISDMVPLFAEINPVNGEHLASQLCMQVAQTYSDYMHQEPDAELPDIRLTYPRQLALIKIARDPARGSHARMDAQNALEYCHARTMQQYVPSDGEIKDEGWARLGVEQSDMRQSARIFFQKALQTYDWKKGVYFNTWIDWLIQRVHREQKRKLRRQWRHDQPREIDEDDNAPGHEAVDTRTPGAGYAAEIQEETVRMLSFLTPQERLFVKLRYGIRFEEPAAEAWGLEEIARLAGCRRSQVQQVLKKAKEKMRSRDDQRGSSGSGVNMPSDGDIYLVVHMGVPVGSPLFTRYRLKTIRWLEERRERIASERAFYLSQAVPWLSYRDQKRKAAVTQVQLMKSTQKAKPLTGPERAKYEAFRRLVSRYVFENNTAQERERLISEIVKMGPLRAPIAKKKVGKSIRYQVLLARRVRAGEAERKWVAQDQEFCEAPWIFPSRYGPFLNIEMRNNESDKAPWLYNSYWDPGKGEAGRSVGVSEEYTDFFRNTAPDARPPGRVLVRRICNAKNIHTGIPLWEDSDGVTMIYVHQDAALIQLKDGSLARPVWLPASLNEKKERWVSAQLDPGGPCIGSARYAEGEFIPEPGPFFRSLRARVLDRDKGRNLIAHLRALGTVEGGTLLVKRNAIKQTAHALFVSVFDDLSMWTRHITVSNEVKDEGREYFLRFTPAEHLVEVYESSACEASGLVNQRYYDLEGQRFFGAIDEARRRFRMFMSGEDAAPIEVPTDHDGRLCLASKVIIKCGVRNAGVRVLLEFHYDEISGRREIRITDKTHIRARAKLSPISMKCEVIDHGGEFLLKGAGSSAFTRLEIPGREMVQAVDGNV
ncbi:MAG: sigma-70 family RNA polymerase sigma factor [Candidatus Omnitrophota bacterium]